ncbi:MAG TPA: NAD-dependent epimerase/dehydratase family protein [Dehalococcoidia bacterium]|nr:NAD-dependent epimerase/dehydratase family protein [Dehalococcoidia bacterium]
MLKGSKVLVTGGSGFIGSHLVKGLTAKSPREIIVFDKHIQHDKFQPRDNLKTVQGEITQRERLREIMPEVDYVFHLAVLPLGACIENPRACLETNINGTFNIIEAAKDAGVKKIVFSSASSVYGDTEQTMDESHPLNARTMYGASKIAGEYLLRAFYDMYKLDYVILRYMNVYGPGQEGGLIMNVLKRIKQGLPPIIFNDGSQSFDFVYIDDVINANILAMESDITDEVFNIGGEEEVTVKDAVFALLELTGSDLTPEFKLDEKVPMQRRVGTSQKAKKLLGYIPRVSLKDGLRKVIETEFKI